MKIFSLVLLVAMGASPLLAAEDTVDEKDQEKVREELREARLEMEKAARRVAELSRRIGAEQRFILDDVRRELLHARMEGREGRLMLGVTVGSGSERMGGLEVFSVTPGGPADKAGVQAGDIITAIGDTALDGEDGAGTLSEALEKIEKGEAVKLAYRRGSDERTVDIVPEEIDRRFRFIAPLAPPARAPGMPMAPRFLDLVRGWGNIELVNVSEELGEYFGTDKGLLIVSTPEDDELELQDGDVILAIGGREPDSPAHAMRILGSYQAGEKVSIEIMRKRKKQSVEIEIPERRVSIRMAPRIEQEIITGIVAPK